MGDKGGEGAPEGRRSGRRLSTSLGVSTGLNDEEQDVVHQAEEERGLRLTDALASVDGILKGALDGFVLQVGEQFIMPEVFKTSSPEDMLALLTEVAQSAFATASRGTSDSLRSLSEGETLFARKQLKAQVRQPAIMRQPHPSF